MAYYERYTEFKPDITPTAVRVTHPIFWGGVPRKIGDELTVPYHEAAYVASMGRCEIIRRVETTQ